MATGVLTKITKVEGKLFLRDTTTSLIALLLPVGLLVVFGAIGLGEDETEPDDVGISPAFVPVMAISLSIAMLALSVVPTVLATYREKGILRRLGTTPVHPSWVLAGQLIVNVAAAVVGVIIVLVLGALAFDFGWPENWLAFFVSFVLFTSAMMSVGLVIAAVAKTAKQGTGIGMLVFFPSMFFAGIWTPGDLMPEWARPIRDWSPMGAGMEALSRSWEGDWPDAKHLIAMLLATVVFGIIGARIFRWE